MNGLWSNQIKNCLSNLSYFNGVYAKDTYVLRHGAAVINTAKSNSNGEHWVAIIIEPHLIFYFDSYGLPPWPALTRRINQTNIPWTYYPRRLQLGSLPTCGHYCVYLIRNYGKAGLFSHFTDINTNDYLIIKIVGTCNDSHCNGQTCKPLNQ